MNLQTETRRFIIWISQILSTNQSDKNTFLNILLEVKKYFKNYLLQQTLNIQKLKMQNYYFFGIISNMVGINSLLI